MPTNMEGTRPPTGASPTQPYKCGQNVKIKIKNRVGIDFDFDFDFKHTDRIYKGG